MCAFGLAHIKNPEEKKLKISTQNHNLHHHLSKIKMKDNDENYDFGLAFLV
jgi:hypothetical protein